MTETEELQQLSRDAAGCLPEDCWQYMENDFDQGYALVGPHKIELWLHESTEACSEIMVRVLWAEYGVGILGHELGCFAYSPDLNPLVWMGHNVGQTYKEVGDPMLAFRVAVLRAVVALRS